MLLALWNTSLMNCRDDYDLMIFCCGPMWNVLPITINVVLQLGYTEVATFTKTILLGLLKVVLGLKSTELRERAKYICHYKICGRKTATLQPSLVMFFLFCK